MTDYSAESWPTEEAATAAVEAAARKRYDTQVEARREVFPPSVKFRTWDELPANEKLTIKQSVLPFVWAALEALPDPRYAAWAEGYTQAIADEHGVVLTSDEFATENPYPSGL